MICRQCGTEIADKAIICYRCGAGTADPVRKPVEVRRRRGVLLPLVILILLLLAALFFGYEYHVVGIDILIDFPPIHA
jgi:uncharacterized paraquat-inducible protein A